ncbi:MAG TPA: pectin acetylesterase-family hydrolase [Polyangiaceae bacterium]|jgi:hypothetical protein
MTLASLRGVAPLLLSLLLACGGSSSPLLGAASDGGTDSASGPAIDAGTADASDDDSATSPDGGASSATPITAPPDTWTWVDFPDSKCGSGSATGIGINPHAGSTELTIYLEGGGACSDAASCWGANPTADNMAGYDATTFAAAKQLKYALLDRALAANPLAQSNLVYVPYCTGDMHAGTTVAQLTGDGGTIPTYFWGAHDLDLFLRRLVPTFTGTTRVYLYGTSAGGFGTVLNFDRVARAFGVRVDVIDDSGPAITAKGQTTNQGIFNAWGIQVPAACAGCNSLPQVLSFDRAQQPKSRYGFLSFAEDDVIAPRFGYAVAEYPAVISGYSSSLASDANAATFVVTNETSHVVESDGTLASQFLPWLKLMLSDDATWKDATYAHP